MVRSTLVSSTREVSICYIAIEQYLLRILKVIIFYGLASHFQMKKTLFVMMIIMVAKTEFLQLREDARLKTDFTGKFWGDIQNKYPIL